MSSVSLLCGILLALRGVVVVADLGKTLQYCCALGRENALNLTKCETTVTVPIRNVRSDQQNICSSTITLCCHQFRRNAACNNGKQVAEEGGICDKEIKTDQDMSFKHCCEACKLGKESGLLAGSCDLSSIPFSSPWKEVFTSCCVNVTLNRSTSPPVSSVTFVNELTRQMRCEAYNPCQHNCHYDGKSITCSCYKGYELLPDAKNCRDVNECQVNSHNCDTGTQRCDNTIGSYHCVRIVGCGTGYTLNGETGDCEDDDECLLGTDNCKSQGSEYECKNINGSFRCHKKNCNSPNCTHTSLSTPSNVINNKLCPRGFQLKKPGTCIDIDECKTASVCKTGMKCINTEGSYFCAPSITCPAGLRLNETSNQCVDIDECKEQPGVCDQICLNLWGSFVCSCEPGFSLHQDNRSCVDVNECELFKDRSPCMGTCVNTRGSYRCQCPDGYQLTKNGAGCQDIDECELKSRCNSSEICFNMRGSHRCNAIECPNNYEKDLNQKNRCIRAAYYCSGYDLSEECLQTPNSYSFNYLNLVSNVSIPTSGYLNLFNVRGGLQNGFTKYDWSLEVNVRAPAGIPRVQDDDFYLNKVTGNLVSVTLKRSIVGPQEIEINLRMNIYSKGLFVGFNIFKLFIYVSTYDF